MDQEAKEELKTKLMQKKGVPVKILDELNAGLSKEIEKLDTKKKDEIKEVFSSIKERTMKKY